MISYKKLKDLTQEEYDKLKFAEKWATFHGKPKTRREFMTAGLIGGGATLVLPSMLSLLAPEEARAAACAAAGAGGILQVDLQNGWSISHNVPPLDLNGAFLSTYGDLGLGTSALVQQNVLQPFGTGSPYFSNLSQFLVGLQSKATPATIANANCLAIWCQSQDDTASNAYDATPMVSALMSGSGSFLGPLGQNTQQSPAVLSAVPELAVNSLSDITNAVGVQGAIASLTGAQKGTLFSLIQNLSSTQLASIANTSGAAMITQITQAATATNVQLVSNASSGLDPQQAAGFNTGNIFTFTNASDLTNASVIYNAFNGNAVCANINFSGYDYHGQGITVENQKDNAAGVVVGQALQAAANMGVKCSIIVSTAGSVGYPVSATSGAGASGDDGTHGGLLLFCYDPAGRHAQTGSQAGAFTSNGVSTGVDQTFSFSTTPANAMAVAVANIASHRNQITAFNNIPTVGTLFTSTDFSANVVKIQSNIVGT
jgi:hypothetical protein